jgi:hypothetical protein
VTISFQRVEIERDYSGRLKGTISVKGDYGRTNLNLTEDLCAKILSVCADNIVEAAEETARNFKAEAMQIESEAPLKLEK